MDIIIYEGKISLDGKELYSESFKTTAELDMNIHTFLTQKDSNIHITASVNDKLVFNSGNFKHSDLDKQLSLAELAVEKEIEYREQPVISVYDEQ